MKQQDKLRDTLREYYDTQQAPFNEGDWNRASAYLSAARRKNKIRRFVVIFFVIVSGLSIVLFNFTGSTGIEKRGCHCFLIKSRSLPLPQKQ